MASKLYLILVIFIGCQLVTFLLTIGFVLTKKILLDRMTVRSQDERQNNSLVTGGHSVRLMDIDNVQFTNEGFPAPKKYASFIDPKKDHNPGHSQVYNDSIQRDSGAENMLRIKDTKRQYRPRQVQFDNETVLGAKNKQLDKRTFLGDEVKQQFNDTNIHCNLRHFKLKNDGICHPMLNCKDIKDNVIIMKRINYGAVKDVYLAKWKKYTVSLVRLRMNSWGLHWFISGARKALKFQPSPLVIQILGYCPTIPAMITEYHPFGSLENINRILKNTRMNNVTTRFRLCLDYIKILHFLHTHPTGTHVMCDSNDLTKTLSQFLITSDLHLVVNDLDALPVIDSNKGKLTNCIYKGLRISADETFAAPEQIWSHKRSKSKRRHGPKKVHIKLYDEKSDIWKIPPVVDYLLGRGSRIKYFDKYRVLKINLHLSEIHQRCRSVDPKKRPTAAEVLRAYLDVQHKLTL